MSGARWVWLDALRGLALGGIALVNLTWFTGHAVLDPAASAALPTAAVDGALRTVIHVLVDAKLYSLFALLFGIGYGLVHRRLGPGAWHRRMGVLLVLGAVHATGLWFGDILGFYALVGFALPLTRRLSPRGLMVVALACLAAPVVQHGLMPPVSRGLGPSGALEAFAHGSYLEMLVANASFLEMRWILALEEGRLFKIAGMVLLGLYVERKGVVARPGAHRAWLRRAASWGFAIGLPLELVRATLELGEGPAMLMAAVGVPALASAYAAAFTLWPWRGLAPAGRMSLTFYLLQSVIGIGLFYGCGLGGWGTVGPTLIIVVAAIQLWVFVRLGRWWFARFERGPVEALWRRLAR